MESSSGVPTPDDDGVSGSQRAGEVVASTDSSPPLQGEYLERTLVGLAAARTTKFGGDFSAPLISAMVSQISYDRDLAREERDQARNDMSAKQAELEKVTAELHLQRLENVKVHAEINQLRMTGVIKQVCAFVSPVLFTIAIALSEKNIAQSAVIAVIATALLLVNFFYFRRKQS